MKRRLKCFAQELWVAVKTNPKTTIPALLAQVGLILSWFHVGFDLSTQASVGGELIVLMGLMSRDGNAPVIAPEDKICP